MNITTAFIISIIAGSIGICSFILLSTKHKNEERKKYYVLIGILGLSIYLSFIPSVYGNRLNISSTIREEVPIEKVTYDKIYFADKYYSIDYFTIEKSNEKYNNVVLIETETYELQWICRLKVKETKYHVYISEDIFYALKDRVIYEKDK